MANNIWTNQNQPNNRTQDSVKIFGCVASYTTEFTVLHCYKTKLEKMTPEHHTESPIRNTTNSGKKRRRRFIINNVSKERIISEREREMERTSRNKEMNRVRREVGCDFTFRIFRKSVFSLFSEEMMEIVCDSIKSDRISWKHFFCCAKTVF